MDTKFYLLFNFIFYSFIGWIIEEVYSFYIAKKFKDEGFLIGPFKPMYGIAFTSLIICNEILKIDGIPLILLCFLIPTTVEYISGYILKHIFNKVYWDYSHFKYNIYGYITLSFSIKWMFLSFIGIYFFQPIIHNYYKIFESIFSNVLYVCALILILDLMITVEYYIKYGSIKKQISE